MILVIVLVFFKLDVDFNVFAQVPVITAAPRRQIQTICNFVSSPKADRTHMSLPSLANLSKKLEAKKSGAANARKTVVTADKIDETCCR
jgi:hypothetical protein